LAPQVEKQTLAYKNIVVEVTEDAICNAVGSWVAMMKTNDKTEGSTTKPNDNGDDDDVRHLSVQCILR
jgi:hypothetical protein